MIEILRDKKNQERAKFSCVFCLSLLLLLRVFFVFSLPADVYVNISIHHGFLNVSTTTVSFSFYLEVVRERIRKWRLYLMVFPDYAFTYICSHQVYHFHHFLSSYITILSPTLYTHTLSHSLWLTLFLSLSNSISLLFNGPHHFLYSLFQFFISVILSIFKIQSSSSSFSSFVLRIFSLILFLLLFILLLFSFSIFTLPSSGSSLSLSFFFFFFLLRC